MRAPIDIAETVYCRFHRGQAASQMQLSREFGLSKGSTNNIVNGVGRFSWLREKYPHLQRSTQDIHRPGRPARVAKKETQLPVDDGTEPVIELAEAALNQLPSLSPEAAIFFSRFAYLEFSDLVRMTHRPCPRLDRYFTRPGRPKSSSKKEAAATELDEDTELMIRERESEAFLEKEKV